MGIGQEDKNPETRKQDSRKQGASGLRVAGICIQRTPKSETQNKVTFQWVSGVKKP